MWNQGGRRLLLLCLLPLLVWLPAHLYALDLVFNGFRPSDLLLYGDATLFPATGVSASVSNSSQYLSMTNVSEFSVGRALYKSKVAMTSPNSSVVLPFSASFIFSIAPIRGTLPGHGIAFLFSPVPGIQGPATAQAAQHLGLFNRTIDGDPSNGVVAVELDVFENEEFHDIDNNHVGIDVFSLTSRAAHPAGYWAEGDGGSDKSNFVSFRLNDGSNYQAWVDYSDGKLNVTLAPVGLGMKPRNPLISLDLNLSNIFEKEMYLGFCGATGRLVENHRVLGWSFSNSNLSLSQALITTGLPNFIPPQVSSRSKALIAGISTGVTGAVLATVGLIALHWRRRWRRRMRKDTTGPEKEDGSDDGDAAVEPWESEYWPHRIGYREILSATEGFSEKNLIGSGGNGKVYKGVLGGSAVAVKYLSRHTGEESSREFLTEVSTLGRLQHRNVVGLKGWCRRRSGDVILVYEYMENGSLDKHIFLRDASGGGGSSGSSSLQPQACQRAPLDWPTRVGILKDVAAGVLYLHEGWESRVLHRDIKASNVVLDGDMVARLSDFGLARVHAHGGVPRTTRVVGTVGYMAPEVMRNGKATAATDVFGFGVLVLEVVSGRRAIIEDKTNSNMATSGGGSPAAANAPPQSPQLVEWVWGLLHKGEASKAIDPKLKGTDGFDEEEAVRSLRLGLWCACSDPSARPSMRQVVSAWDGGRGLTGLSLAEAGEGDVSAAEAYLVEKLRTATPPPPWTADPSLMCCYRGALGLDPDHQHLTFEELRLSSSITLEGR